MMLTCKHCGFISKSHEIMAEKAWAECYGSLMTHVGIAHRPLVEMFTKSMQQVTIMVASQCSLLEFAVIPEEDVFINEYMENIQDKIMEAIGFEPDEEEIEEEEVVNESDKEIVNVT